jgi:hypothetical protein
MDIQVKRFEFGTNYTISKMSIDGVFECYVLEDKVREVPDQPVEQWKIAGQTAIPVGSYKVTIDFSTRFARDMPHILNVPGFSGIRIHSGNTDADTEGCLLLGSAWNGGDFISQSRNAFNNFFPKLYNAVINKEDITLTIGE